MSAQTRRNFLQVLGAAAAATGAAVLGVFRPSPAKAVAADQIDRQLVVAGSMWTDADAFKEIADEVVSESGHTIQGQRIRHRKPDCLLCLSTSDDHPGADDLRVCLCPCHAHMSILFTREHGTWYGHCLDLDVLGEGPDLDSARASTIGVARMILADDPEGGFDPWDRRAPQVFWDLFDTVRAGDPGRPPGPRVAELVWS